MWLSRLRSGFTEEAPLWLRLILVVAVTFALAWQTLSPEYRRGDVSDIDVDPLVAVNGYYAYVQDDWHFPLLHTDLVAAPEGAMVLFTDSIPLVCVLGKLVYLVYPELWNPYPAWLLAMSVAQGLATLWVLHLLRIRSLGFVVAAAVVMTHLPAFQFRYFHASLTAHFAFTVCFGLWVATREGRHLRAAAWGAAALLAGTMLIHAYIFAMTAALLAAWWLWVSLQRGTPLWFRLALPPAGSAVIALVYWVGGYATPPVAAGWESGWGNFAMNGLSPFYPRLSGFFPGMPDLNPVRSGEYEGFNYLGLGVILLLGLALIRRPLALARVLGRYWPLTLCLIGLMGYAWSTTIYVGTWKLASYDLPALHPLFAAFRSSGRFFWPCAYATLLLALVMVWRAFPRGWALGLVVVAAGLQVYDTRPLRPHGVNQLPAEQEVWDRQEWRKALARFERVALYPDLMCTGWEVSREGLRLQHQALRVGVPTSTSYLSRPFRDCEDVKAQWQAETFEDPDTLYVVHMAHAREIRLFEHIGPDVRVWRFAGNWVLSRRPELLAGLEQAGLLLPTDFGDVPAQAAYRFGEGDVGSLLLLEGFSGVEPWGTWGEGTRSLLRVPIAPTAAGTCRLRFDAIMYLPPSHPENRLSLWLGDRMLGEWMFRRDAPFPVVEVDIPVEAGEQRLALEFRVDHAMSPAEAEGTSDLRPLGLGLRGLEVEYRAEGPGEVPELME